MGNIIACKRCVMDNVGCPDLRLDAEGICNYCHEYFKNSEIRVVKDDLRKDSLNNLISQIKKAQKNNQYDCVIGVSGGADSTYVAYLVKELGLRPIAVHFDNGWDSELAVKNIENTMSILNIPLYTEVVHWKSFRDLQLSFLRASTPDGEIPTDHAIMATLLKVASKYNIKYILSGNNFITEGVMPESWAYGHIDWKYIKTIHSKFGKIPLVNFPHFSLMKLFYYIVVRKIRLVSILNYIDYKKSEAVSILEAKLNWRNYGGKHYESTYTKIFQGYILPQKFEIDKRKIHLSALILSGQITREAALAELRSPPYPRENLDFDIDYLVKKLDISKLEFESIMTQDRRTFRDFSNSYSMIMLLRNIVKDLRKRLFLPK